MGKLARGCWIVVADAQGAMIVENVGTDADPDMRLIERFDTPGVSDQDFCDSIAMEVSNRGLIAQSALAAMLTARLSRDAARGMFRTFVIAAPPRLLSMVSDRLSDDLRRRLLVSVPRSLTTEPIGNLDAIIRQAMPEAMRIG